MSAAAAVCIGAAAVCASAGICTSAVVLTVGGTENGPEATAGAGFCGGRKQIQREADVFKAGTGITVGRLRGAAFRHTSAKRMHQHIHGAEQLYDGEQANGDIDCDGGTQSSIATDRNRTGITAAVAVAGIAGRMPQLRRQRHSFPLCHHEGAAIGCTVGELIGNGGDICFRGGLLICKIA